MTSDLGIRIRPSRFNRLALWLLRSPLQRWFADQICRLDYIGRSSGARYTLPVAFVRDRDRLIVFVGNASRKRWWRNFRGTGRSLVVSGGTESFDGYAVASGPDDVGYPQALFGYVQHHRAPTGDDHRFVVIRLLDRIV